MPRLCTSVLSRNNAWAYIQGGRKDALKRFDCVSDSHLLLFPELGTAVVTEVACLVNYSQLYGSSPCALGSRDGINRLPVMQGMKLNLSDAFLSGASKVLAVFRDENCWSPKNSLCFRTEIVQIAIEKCISLANGYMYVYLIRLNVFLFFLSDFDGFPSTLRNTRCGTIAPTAESFIAEMRLFFWFLPTSLTKACF